jgi:hypothetical protein
MYFIQEGYNFPNVLALEAFAVADITTLNTSHCMATKLKCPFA